eukprot:NODE_4550_length_1878_cov_4.269560.p1 GENE.NODE_4550_length_1878_cov_4.269560~~NODE_4550_length_1878_cov_4.269560.p1  ORF type:complete len:571 (-),score=174.74 NODE_4550_length_1878_cov_4.269560:165-1790(-)
MADPPPARIACAEAAARAYRPRSAINPREPLPAIFSHIDSRVAEYVSILADAVAVPSLSSDKARRPDCLEMVSFYRSMMDRLGVENEVRELGMHMCCGEEVVLPPVILGRYGSDLSKPTICAYGHLDVQPALKADGWHTDPFTLTFVPRTAAEDAEQGYGQFPSYGKLYGRGSTDDKGPALSWLFVIEAFKMLGQELPVNLLFLVECMEESSSIGLDAVVKREFAEGGYLAQAEAVCVADNYWIGVRKPTVQFGLRGMVKFNIEVTSAAGRDQHSGRGGAIFEPMAELTHLLASLTSPGGEILVPGIKELVAPVTEEERNLYDGIDMSLESLSRLCGVDRLLHSDEGLQAVMLHVWRMPSLCLHGIEGAHSGPGSKTVIPGRVVGKFSIRLVPHMRPEDVSELVRAHCERVFASFNSPNTMRLTTDGLGSEAFAGNPNDKNYRAARRANACIYGVEPDCVCSGGTIPVTLTMQQTGRSVVLFPIGRTDDGAHAQNEKIDLANFIDGIKLIATYLVEYPCTPEEMPLPPSPPQPDGEVRLLE